ncbi:aminoacyl tRNA synthase complex-interacting multifunctional protein 1-like [Halichoeres trimaculatus]|uniref:aminoacyl tRNA synthase complex-interacting multifunctional protein 1-like n=1 Tax=Halichoeres trimaculatus TaxID=147232 RepID=UPI003D9F8AA5
MEGSNVPCKADLREMGYRGRVSTHNRTRVKEKAEREQAPLGEDEVKVDVSCLDLHVGVVISALQLPDRDSVYLLQVDAGEAPQRTVVSQIAKSISLDQIQNRMVVLLYNLEPAKIRGALSQAELMCTHSPGKVETLNPSNGAVPGDTFQCFPGKRDKELMSKQKVWEQVQTDLCTDPQCVATYKRAAFEVISKGECRAQTLSNTEIK